jgi:hypothetical protein
MSTVFLEAPKRLVDGAGTGGAETSGNGKEPA